jgi:CRP-like cAMP-binding protein
MPNSASDVTPNTTRNRLLLGLPEAELERLSLRLERIRLPIHTTVLMPGQDIESVLFLESGTVSMIVMLEDGAQIEVGLVGREGAVGLPVILGATTSPLEGVVQVESEVLRLPASNLQAALADAPSLFGLLLRYFDAFHTQVSLTAACNGRHQIEQRLARWILMTHDRVDGDSFQMTQEFLSHMIGVRRPGVTLAVGVLQRAGLVRHGRGMMEVLDRPGLEAVSCECYELARRRYTGV